MMALNEHYRRQAAQKTMMRIVLVVMRMSYIEEYDTYMDMRALTEHYHHQPAQKMMMRIVLVAMRLTLR